MERLQKLEAPLHHAIEMFFTLAPNELIAQFFDIDPAEAANLRMIPWQRLESVTAANGKNAPLCELCQPDMLFDGRNVQVAVEIKAKSKSSLEQVLKYAALTSLRPRSTAARKLVFLAPYEGFSQFWDRRAHDDVESLKDAARKFDSPKLVRQFQRFGTSLEGAKAQLDTLQISWKPVRDLRRLVSQELTRVTAEVPSASGEVYRKLLSGFETELLRWQPGE